jgi:putative sterol carrier protein
MTDKEYFVKIRPAMDSNPDIVKSINGSFQFDFSPSGDGKYYFIFENGGYQLEDGSLAGASVKVTCKWQVFEDIREGKLDPNMAMMTGKMKFKGDLVTAMQLGKIFQLKV